MVDWEKDFYIIAIYNVGEGWGDIRSGLLRQTAGEYVGGARLAGKYSFGGGQASHSSEIFYCINAEDVARDARFNNNFQCLCM
jgi:hypothetical protein